MSAGDRDLPGVFWGPGVIASSEKTLAVFNSLTAEANPERTAHLERGARIAFRALEAQAVPLTDDEREWYAAELKRVPRFELFLVKYDPAGVEANRARIGDGERMLRAEAEAERLETMKRWEWHALREIEPDGSRWAVEIREAGE